MKRYIVKYKNSKEQECTMFLNANDYDEAIKKARNLYGKSLINVIPTVPVKNPNHRRFIVRHFGANDEKCESIIECLDHNMALVHAGRVYGDRLISVLHKEVK